MSYPIDLDEMDEAKLVQEIERRKKARDAGLCDYCGREPDTNTCKFSDRHKEKVEVGGEWYCRNCGYLSASRVTFHETCDECHIPVEWHDLDKMTAFEEADSKITRAISDFESIIIRCREGGPGVDWLKTIDSIAAEAIRNLKS